MSKSVSFLTVKNCLNSFQAMTQYEVVMVCHGESEWNKENLFCGWFDSKLSDKGKKEAAEAGQALKDAGYNFDIAFTSVLSRAQETLQIILQSLEQPKITVVKTWRLNERHYGALTGLNKTETAVKYGAEQVTIWQFSFDVPPPPIEPDHPYYQSIVNDSRYQNGPSPDHFPKFESLELTIERTLLFWNENIVPQIKDGKRVIIAAHGNSLRGIIKHLDQLNHEQIMALNIPTAIPFVYTLNEHLKPVPDGSLKFLGDPETVKKAMNCVANQGKDK